MMEDSSAQQPMRIARYLALCGAGSRRQCEDFVLKGRVKVNGEVVATPALNVDPALDQVLFDGRSATPEIKRYVLLNKPPGVTCSANDPFAGALVGDLVPTDLGRLFNVGRLDRDSEGLLLMTNDGGFAQRICHPSHGIAKTYKVWCVGWCRDAQLKAIRAGVHDHGELLKPLRADIVEENGGAVILRLVLGEGRKREIRRLCKGVGLTVNRLQRVAIGSLELGCLALGQWRELSDSEVDALLRECRH